MEVRFPVNRKQKSVVTVFVAREFVAMGIACPQEPPVVVQMKVAQAGKNVAMEIVLQKTQSVAEMVHRAIVDVVSQLWKLIRQQRWIALNRCDLNGNL